MAYFPIAFFYFLYKNTLNQSFLCVLIPVSSKLRLKKSLGNIYKIVFESAVGGVSVLSHIYFPFSSRQQSIQMTQQKVLVLTKQKLMFSRCLSIMGGAFSKVMLYNLFAFILIILNLLGSCPKLSTPERVFFTLSALESIYFTKRQSFCTYFSQMCLLSIDVKGSAIPEQPRFFLCLFRQATPQLLIVHFGQVYLYRAASHTSHSCLRPAVLTKINYEDSSFQLTYYPYSKSLSSWDYITTMILNLIISQEYYNLII